MVSMTQLAESIRTSIREHEPYWDSDWSDGYVTCAKIILEDIDKAITIIPPYMLSQAHMFDRLETLLNAPDTDYVKMSKSRNSSTLDVTVVKKRVIDKVKPIWMTINLEGDEPVITTSEHDPEDKQ